MRPIVDSRVFCSDGTWQATCKCGKTCGFSTKAAALKMLAKGVCRHCKVHYSHVVGSVPIYRNAEGKWCSVCSGCGVEQGYTRKDHAKQSQLSDWQCKKCVAKAKGFSGNMPVGDEMRLYNKFRKSANSRGVLWDLSFTDFVGCYTGECALTGWELSMIYSDCTASFDRIDSSKPYELGNIQWVHTMVNMCKNKYGQDKFIKMCKAISAKW